MSRKYSNIESVGRFMYIFMEYRKDLCKKWCFLRSVGRICQKYGKIESVASFMYIFVKYRKDLLKKMVFADD